MPTIADFRPQGRTIILTGAAGCGKSTFATRFPGCMFFITDPNALPGPIKVARHENRDIGAIRYEYLHETADGKPVPIGDRFERLVKLVNETKNDPTIQTRVFDSTTTLVPVFKAYVLKKAGKDPVNSLLEGWTQWDQFAALWMQLMDWCLQSNQINIFIAHEQPEKDQMDAITRYALAIPGKSGDNLPRLVSDCWLMSVTTKMEGNPPVMVGKYNITTIQNPLRPNIKASLDLPTQFPANQEWADKIVAQIVGGQAK